MPERRHRLTKRARHFKRPSRRSAANFVNVLDKLPAGFRAGSQEMRFCIEMVQLPEVFHKLVELRPNDKRLWYARGRVCAGERKWGEAVSNYAAALELYAADLESGGGGRAAHCY